RLRGDLALLGEPPEPRAYLTARSLEGGAAGIVKDDPESGGERRLGDPGAHGARADDGESVGRGRLRLIGHLTALEFGLAPLEKGAHSLRPVFGGEERLKALPLQPQRGLERQVRAAKNGVLDGRDGHGRQRRDALGDLERVRQYIAVGYHLRQQTQAVRLARGQQLAGQQPSHGCELARRARETLRPAGAGHDAELDFRLSELGALPGDDDVAVHGELAAAPERKSVHRGDDGPAIAL